MTKDPAEQALEAILQERDYQRERWGDDHDKDHGPDAWYLILGVWFGKLANETPSFRGASYYDKLKFLKRLAQIGAIAAAAYESLLRQADRK